jgi:hypothetical protein
MEASAMAIETFNAPTGPGVTINDNATASTSLTPLIIPVLGKPWFRIVDLQVRLSDLTHSFPDDLDFLLVGPDGRNFEFWSDAGGNSPISNGTFFIADSAASLLPDQTAIAPGMYRPTNYGFESSSNWSLPGLIINSPAPASTATLESVFGGVWFEGTWSLHVRDDASPNAGSLGSWGLQGTLARIVKPDDFNGNLKSDILWQNSDGLPAMWLMDDASATSVGGIGPFGPFPSDPGPSWHIKDDGDFDGDGRSDILWQNDDGTPSIWLMNGFSAQSMGAVGPVNPGPSWQIKATGDFNFDTKSDILWQGADGTPAIWLMDGLNFIGGGAVGPTNPGPSWQIKGTGYFNNDGKSDILWQAADGTAAIWLMDGLNFIRGGAVGPVNPGPSWQIKGTGDFNDDGNSDILWQNSDGTPAIWLMNGLNISSSGAVGPVNPGPSWHVEGTGDYDGDGRSDILWQGADGTPAIWFMNGLNFISGGIAGSFNPGADWHVIA